VHEVRSRLQPAHEADVVAEGPGERIVFTHVLLRD